MVMGSRALVCCLLASCFATVGPGSGSARAAIVISGYTDATNDRFTNSGSFLLSGFDLSGIGQDASGHWATAIGRNVVISAAHLAPTGTVTFYPANDPGDVPVTIGIADGEKITETDLWIGTLESNLPDAITNYAFATEMLSGPSEALVSAGTYQGVTAFTFGLSQAVNPATRDQAVGQNRITGYVENVDFLGNADNDSLLMQRDDPGDTNFVTYESFFQGGDSGGPTFVDDSGQLVLVGTNAFRYNADDPFAEDPITGSGINYIANQSAFINQYIQAAAVPEPSSLALLTGVTALIVRRRKRKSSSQC
ncbi:PEP-CTERM sorting domain-containing protein [Crateriforma spongiae]|uniref:PEP-CTERM sorting domain-containing protein n=1 Tax=Crateriforma spongiae TaxID=2724528 RepID=UPI00198149ED|nr:PEP-CTERM sorting domain-containing protein [Crateriforma spongiae]